MQGPDQLPTTFSLLVQSISHCHGLSGTFAFTAEIDIVSNSRDCPVGHIILPPDTVFVEVYEALAHGAYG